MFGRAVETRRVITTGDYLTDASFPHEAAPDRAIETLGVRSMIVAPLFRSTRGHRRARRPHLATACVRRGGRGPRTGARGSRGERRSTTPSSSPSCGTHAAGSRRRIEIEQTLRRAGGGADGARRPDGGPAAHRRVRRLPPGRRRLPHRPARGARGPPVLGLRCDRGSELAHDLPGDELSEAPARPRASRAGR